MVTDVWVRPGNPLSHIPSDWARRLSERFHPDLEAADVRDHTTSLLKREVEWRLEGRRGWDLFIPRNQWFQAEVAEQIRTIPTTSAQKTIVFAHSYSALHILRAAKLRGWTTVLGQIDPGQEHFNIVRQVSAAYPECGPAPASPPASYFESWREECALADHIVVNSEWSRDALARAGVGISRVKVVPLAHEVCGKVEGRRYPDRFTPDRPLRLLFVGTVSAAKGAVELFEAMAESRDLPVRLRVVGPMGMDVPERCRVPSIEFSGAVPRGDMPGIYAESDALIFPSHSDGFGMAQIEAQAAALPIVASQNCGRVVEHNVTGVLLPAVTANELQSAIRRIVEQPLLLQEFSHRAVTTRRSSLTALADALAGMVERCP